MGAEQRDQIRELHDQGMTTNAIARALGIPRGEVAPQVRALASEQAERHAEPEVVGCWINAGWSVGLGVPAARRWPDEPRHKVTGVGAVAVLVARKAQRGVSVCGYLVDTYCLGVKNTLGPRAMSPRRLDRFRDEFFTMFDGNPVAVPIELAQHLVWGAVAYARDLGLSPHHDFRAAAGHLGELAGPSAIRFGLDGVPTYMSGPYDDVDRILRTLDRNVGLDNIHYTVEVAV